MRSTSVGALFYFKEKKMKVAVVGSRNIVVENIQQFLPENVSEIISGGAKGVDTCAEEYAKNNGIKMTVIKPDYKKYGKPAPLVRNKEIVKNAEFVVLVWDGKSRGTKFVLEHCEKINKPHKVYII